MFFTHCPKITPELCGKNTELRKNMTLKATTTKQTFKIDTLKHVNKTDAKLNQFDACYYIIETPQYLYREGTMKM